MTRKAKEQLLLELSNESTVEINLLAECPDLIKMINEGKSKEECLKWINENF